MYKFKGFVERLTGTLMHICLCLAWMETVHIESSCVYPPIRVVMVVGFIWAASATPLVCVRNTLVFRTALTALTEPRTLRRRIRRCPSPRRRVALHSISKMYFSHCKPPGVSERMWSVNLDASISGEYQTLGGHSCRPSE